ncbi:hypothetical protein OH77DRAFT_985775 [Trametes cingulata]|nr:hypothetical protein OH77DRAFT_985775 [Trametes cingulata]
MQIPQSLVHPHFTLKYLSLVDRFALYRPSHPSHHHETHRRKSRRPLSFTLQAPAAAAARPTHIHLHLHLLLPPYSSCNDSSQPMARITRLAAHRISPSAEGCDGRAREMKHFAKRTRSCSRATGMTGPALPAGLTQNAERLLSGERRPTVLPARRRGRLKAEREVMRSPLGAAAAVDVRQAD